MKLTLLVGPPGSGKSTFVKGMDVIDYNEFAYINQDSQGKNEHLTNFKIAVENKRDIIVDRMNFNKEQRKRYIDLAPGYDVEIHILHEAYDTCLKRCKSRKDHETIKNEEDAKKALNFFFKHYERPTNAEGKVFNHYPKTEHRAIICDLDGTLCDIEHRRKHVSDGKANWGAFFAGIKEDGLNEWCYEIITSCPYFVVLCSGRGEEYRGPTEEWLADNLVMYDKLFMRFKGDRRKDSIVKEILLDFEILTRFKVNYIIDDRKSVVDMWRKRGFVCLQCAEGDF